MYMYTCIVLLKLLSLSLSLPLSLSLSLPLSLSPPPLSLSLSLSLPLSPLSLSLSLSPYRHLCVFVDAKAVYCTLAEILASEEKLSFASLMVRELNTILFSSANVPVTYVTYHVTYQ